MLKLADFESVNRNLKSSKKSIVCKLHLLLFQNEGDRNNRKRIREFSGFNLSEREFQEKLKDARTKFDLVDLICVCNLLDLKMEGHEDVYLHLMTCLNDLNNFKTNLLDESESETDNDDEQNTNDVETNSNRNESACLPTNIREVSEIKTEFSKLTISFEDIENSVKSFDGSVYQSVHKWLEEFEDITKLFSLTDLHKLIFAKRLMKGKAKLFLQGESYINSWKKFCITFSAIVKYE